MAKKVKGKGYRPVNGTPSMEEALVRAEAAGCTVDRETCTVYPPEGTQVRENRHRLTWHQGHRGSDPFAAKAFLRQFRHYWGIDLFQ